MSISSGLDHNPAHPRHAATRVSAAIPNLRLPRVRPALGFARSRSQTVEHKVKQVIPGVEGEVLSERAQVFEERLAGG